LATNILAVEQLGKGKTKVSTYPKVQKDIQKADNQSVVSKYSYLNRVKNPNYEASLKELPFLSCLIHDNSAVSTHKIRYIKTQPKWFTDLWKDDIDANTGEYLGAGIYRTDEIKQSNGNRIKRLDAFCSHYQPLYERREVSLLFYTLTIANQAKTDIGGIIDVLKKRLKRREVKFYDYFWIAEVSPNRHFHYHLVIATERLNYRGSKRPKWLDLSDAWGAIAHVEFVKKNIRHYMAKYMAKHNHRVLGIRHYGTSMRKNKNS
jgi:hypothetical protein